MDYVILTASETFKNAYCGRGSLATVEATLTSTARVIRVSCISNSKHPEQPNICVHQLLSSLGYAKL